MAFGQAIEATSLLLGAEINEAVATCRGNGFFSRSIDQ
jgi:hypothetical protein